MVLLVCLTFVGQAMASTILSYRMMSMAGMNAQEQVHDMSKIAHASYQMVSDSSDGGSERPSKECCVNQAHDMSKMAHASYQMASVPSDDDSETSSEECCVKACDCFASGCMTAVVLIDDESNKPIIIFSVKINSPTNLAQSQQLTSLYRPPILG